MLELFQVVKLAFSFFFEEKFTSLLVNKLIELMIDIILYRREVVIMKLMKLRNLLI